MRVKLLEVRDAMTFIPVWAFRMREDEAPSVWDTGDAAANVHANTLIANTQCQAFLLRRGGFAPGDKHVMLGSLQGMACEYDPMAWRNDTLRTAHLYITAHFDELEDGAVIDCEFITGKSEAPKRSERIDRAEREERERAEQAAQQP